MTTSTPDLAFLGLGAMGRGMTERLLNEGHHVMVWNRSPGPVAEMVAHPRTSAAESIDEAFSACSNVHSMLTEDKVVLEVFNDDLLAGVPEGRVHVNHATVSPEAATELAERHARHGVGYVSAPVLGRSTIASSGALLVVASGDPASVEQALPALRGLGKQVWNLGADARQASIVKIAVNYSIVSALQSIAESVVLAEGNGIDPRVLIEILTHTAFSGSAHKGYGPLIAEQRYEPVGFAMPLGLKDLSLASDVAKASGIDLPFAPVLRELFESALADETLAGLDWSAVAEVTRARSRSTQQ